MLCYKIIYNPSLYLYIDSVYRYLTTGLLHMVLMLYCVVFKVSLALMCTVLHAISCVRFSNLRVDTGRGGNGLLEDAVEYGHQTIEREGLGTKQLVVWL